MIKSFFEKYRIYVGIFLLLILPVLFILFFVKEKSVEIPLNNNIESEVKEKIFVDISGQVNSPGVYEIEEGKIIWDLIQDAGGFTEFADLEFVAKELNLSRKIVSEDKVYIPQKGESNSSEKPESGSLTNINSASLEELDALPGVGPSTAQKIIDSRPYKSVEDLKNVPGIGDSKYEELKSKITI